MWPRATQYYLAARGLEIHALEAGWVPEPVRVPIPRSRSPQSDHCANPTLKKHKCSFITQVLTVAEWDYMNVYVRIGKERSKPTVTSFCTGDTNENTTTSGKSTKIRTRLHLNESPEHYRCTKLSKLIFTAAKSVYWTGYGYGQPRDCGSIPCKEFYIMSRPSLGSTKPPIQWMLGEIFRRW
jgi:hypothetical protein